MMRDAARLANAALCLLGRAAKSHDSQVMVAEVLEKIGCTRQMHMFLPL